jgi:ATP-dependent phosphoenolpyruvate carboxykinase
MKTPPLCRYCGKPIPKKTDIVWFNGIKHRPASRADVQRLVNGQVVSVSWHHDRSFIYRAGIWDGESYADKFFDTQTCAARFGRWAARNTPIATDDFNRAYDKLTSRNK